MDRILGFLERFCPSIISIVFTSLIVMNVELTNLPPKFDNILNGVITFSSILIGFIGVLISILLTIKDSNLIRELFKKVQGKILKKYFKFSLISGFLVVLFSLILYFNNRPIFIYKEKQIDISIILWTLFLSYFAMSSLRIIDIMMHIIFKDHNIEIIPKGEKLSEEKSDALKEKLRKK